jgi:elongation factor 1 alpha-like protein
MKKARNNYEEEAYEDDDYYDDDYEDDYYEEQEEEEEKPKKKKNANKNNQNNKQAKNDNNKNQQKNQSSNTQSKENSKINSLNVSKKDSNISSSLALSPSSSSSITNSIKEKEKEIKTLKDYNNLESYPKIDYGSNKINQEEKPTINLVIIGHVDSGKSTMIGHLMFLLGLIDQKDFKKKIKSRKSNKGFHAIRLCYR